MYFSFSLSYTMHNNKYKKLNTNIKIFTVLLEVIKNFANDESLLTKINLKNVIVTIIAMIRNRSISVKFFILII